MKSAVGPGAVVVGVDGSSGSDAAVVWAARYAAGHQRPLTIVHGVGVPESLPADFPVDLQQIRHDLLSSGSTITDHARDVVRSIDSDVVVQVRLEAQDPRSLLADASPDAHLLVLGSRGHGAVLSLLLGSVSVALAAHAACPVVVVRSSRDQEASLPVVVGVDGTDDVSSALTFAFELADGERRRLEILHATGEAWLFPTPDAALAVGLLGDMAVDVVADWEAYLAESVAGYAEKYPDVAFTSRVVGGSAAAALVAASEHASTVVVGAGGRSALSKRLLGSVSRSVVEHAHCTVAVARHAQT
jgi:nucleotide-binding universal stress UspA family protein